MSVQLLDFSAAFCHICKLNIHESRKRSIRFVFNFVFACADDEKKNVTNQITVYWT